MSKQRSVFVDTCLFVYLLEHHATYFPIVNSLFSEWTTDGVKIVTSILTVEEYCVYPYKTKNTKLIDNFERLITTANIDIIPINKTIAQTAAWIRSKYSSIKALDALQIASSLVCDCDTFYTNDRQLSYITETPITMLSNLLEKS